MGWFSAKKKTYVSSVVYALGEDGADRTDMMKVTVLNSVLQQRGIAESIQQNFLRGQGMSLRNAFRYARDQYTNGVPTSAARYSDQPDTTVLLGVLQDVNPGYGISFISTVIGTADSEWWAEKYLTDTYGYDRTTERFEFPPIGVEANANVAYDMQPDGSIQILLMNADGAIVELSYRPTTFVRMGNYVHCAYQTVATFDGSSTESTRDAAPGETDRTTFSSVTVERTGETQVTTTKKVVSITGSIATVTLFDTTVVTSRPKYFFYLLGSNRYPQLEVLMDTQALAAPYYPSIPLRVNNVDWTDKAHEKTPLYKTSDKLLKKIGLDIADLGEKIRTNKQVKEIDFCFVTFAVRLNTQSPEGKKYLFRFFDYLRGISTVSSAQFNDWAADFDAKFPNGPNAGALPAGGVTAPPMNSVEIYSPKDRANNHDIKLEWQYIDTHLRTGQVSPNARPGTVTISIGGAEILRDMLNNLVVDSSVFLVRKQIDENTYEELSVSGLVYTNFIYKGKSVSITAHGALTNQKEEGFIIPLNQEIVRATPMVELTNLSYQCMFLVFNCYKVVKQKWYQTTLFKIIIVIIAILIVIFTWGVGTPAATGMTGAAFAAAAALGLVAGTLMFTIVAATIYVLGMMVLMSILMKVAVAAFGPKWGPIVAAVVAIVGMNYAETGTLVGSAAGSSSTLISAQNIIQASSALATAYVNKQLSDIDKDTQKLTDNYNNGMAKIEDLTKANLGTNTDVIDITGFTQATYQNIYETPNTFLSRTLLSGSDVCEITSGLIENFADVGLRLPTTG